MIQLGSTAKDKITGFTGIVVGRVEYISGCNQVFLVPKVDKDGKRRDGEWFDEQRIDVDQKTRVITLENAKTPGSDALPPQR